MNEPSNIKAGEVGSSDGLGGTATAKDKASKDTPEKRTEQTENGAHDIIPSVVISSTQRYWKQNDNRKSRKLYDAGQRDNHRVVWIATVEHEKHAIDGEQHQKSDNG